MDAAIVSMEIETTDIPGHAVENNLVWRILRGRTWCIFVSLCCGTLLTLTAQHARRRTKDFQGE